MRFANPVVVVIGAGDAGVRCGDGARPKRREPCEQR